MPTIIYLTVQVLFFSIQTLYFSKFLMKYNKAIVIIVHFSLLWIVAELFNQIHIWLRNNNIFIELGHASLSSILILILFHIIGLIIIVKHYI